MPRTAWKIQVSPGAIFGRLAVLRELPDRRSGHRMFECKCRCGSLRTVPLARLRYGQTTSCGCYASELTAARNSTHGRSYSSIYHIWRSMVARCHDPNSHAFADYGGRGISVCAEWRNSFPSFLRDVGERPLGMSIERKDNAKGYEPENITWASPAQQSRNKRNNVFVDFNGQRILLIDAARAMGISHTTLRARLKRGLEGAQLFAPMR